MTKTSWRNSTPAVVPVRGQNMPTTDALNGTLMQWGPLQFQIWPLNFNELDHETETDWARKEIAGAANYREWVGENDELLHVRGEMFPYRLGGMSEIQFLDDMRRQGVANMMITGGGDVYGWFVCEKLIRNHSNISGEGVGKMIRFEAVFARIPVPSATEHFAELWAVGVVGA